MPLSAVRRGFDRERAGCASDREKLAVRPAGEEDIGRFETVCPPVARAHLGRDGKESGTLPLRKGPACRIGRAARLSGTLVAYFSGLRSSR